MGVQEVLVNIVPMVGTAKQGESMSKGTVVAIVAVVIVLIAGVSWQLWRMNVTKGEIVLNNRYDAQANVVETTLDTMRKTIMNQHTCTKEWADQFIAVVAKQAEGRPGKVTAEGTKSGGLTGMLTGGGGGIAVTSESDSLGIPPELYLKLANSIEGKLAEFKRSQDTQTDIWQTHKTYCEDPYHNWLGVAMVAKVKEKPVMISSGTTKEAVETKVLDDNLM